MTRDVGGRRILRLGLYPTRAGMVEVVRIAWPYAYGFDAEGKDVAWNARNGRIYCPGAIDNDISGGLIALPLPAVGIRDDSRGERE